MTLQEALDWLQPPKRWYNQLLTDETIGIVCDAARRAALLEKEIAELRDGCTLFCSDLDDCVRIACHAFIESEVARTRCYRNFDRLPEDMRAALQALRFS